MAPALTSVDIDAWVGGERFRVLRGERLDIERDVLGRGRRVVRPEPVGEAEVFGTESTAQALLAEGFSRASTLGVELVGVGPEHEQQVSELLTWATGDAAMAEASAALLRKNVRPWNAPESNDRIPTATGSAAWFDLRLATFHHMEPDGPAARLYLGSRDVRVVVSPKFLLTLWGPVDAETWTVVPGFRHALTHPHRAHLWSSTPINGHTGPERLARLLQSMMRHHEWQRIGCASALDELEAALFASLVPADSLAGSRGPAHFRQMQERLGLLAMFATDLNNANRGMARRAHVEAAFPREVRQELTERTSALDTPLADLGDQLRSTFGVLAEMASFHQLEVSQRASQQTTRFQTAAGVIASLVLGPSLVAAFYGGQITGLPRDNVDSEFLLVAVLSAFTSALVLASVLSSVYLSGWRRRPRTARGFARRRAETKAVPGRGR